MNLKQRKTVRSLGLAWMFVLTMLYTFRFFLAYFSSSKTWTIYINAYGEAHLEFALFIMLLPAVLYVVNDYIKVIKSG